MRDKQAMYEGVLGDFWQTLKNFFIKLKEKIISWFKAAWKYLQTLFLSNKEFIKKFKDEIENKEGEKFEYEMHLWNLNAFKEISSNTSAGEIANLVEKMTSQIYGKAQKEEKEGKQGKQEEDTFETQLLHTEQAELNKTVKDMKKHLDTEFYKTIRNLKSGSSDNDGTGGTISKFKKLAGQYLMGSKEKKSIKGMGSKGLSASDMIEVIENEKEWTDNLKEQVRFAHL